MLARLGAKSKPAIFAARLRVKSSTQDFGCDFNETHPGFRLHL
jgi:hypothetical protein